MHKFSLAIKNIWDLISKTGVAPGKELENREIILSNRVVLISILLVLFFIPLEIILNGFQLVPIELFCGGLFSMVFWFHRKGYYLLAKYFIVLYAVGMIGLMTFMVGGGSGSEFVLLPILITPMILLKKRLQMIIMVVFVAVSFFTISHFSVRTPAMVNVPEAVKQSVQPAMIFMGMIILFFQVYYFKNLNTSYEKLLGDMNTTLKERNKEILDSITYAKRIQSAILPRQDLIEQLVPDSFILYKPKDIVAGDFYWAENFNGLFFIAAADSTGHGVPGAMVSVVCSTALNRTVKEFGITETGKLLDRTRELVIETFENSNAEVKDGMDISLLCIDKKNQKVFWSGANNPLWYIQDAELKEIKADKQPIGKTDNPKPFTTHEIEFKENTVFYLFTDGYADQFGGPKGKKFKYKQLSDLLVRNKDLPVKEQVYMLDKAFSDWQGYLEQVDDVCVIGIKI